MKTYMNVETRADYNDTQTSTATELRHRFEAQ